MEFLFLVTILKVCRQVFIVWSQSETKKQQCVNTCKIGENVKACKKYLFDTQVSPPSVLSGIIGTIRPLPEAKFQWRTVKISITVCLSVAEAS